jgi:hypothetical protein
MGRQEGTTRKGVGFWEYRRVVGMVALLVPFKRTLTAIYVWVSLTQDRRAI